MTEKAKKARPQEVAEEVVSDETYEDERGVKWRRREWETTDEQGRKGRHAEIEKDEGKR